MSDALQQDDRAGRAQRKGRPHQKTLGEVLHDKGTELWGLPADAAISQAIALMGDKDIGAIVVFAPQPPAQRIIGIFSERDYIRKVAQQHKAQDSSPLQQVMSAPLYAVSAMHRVSEGLQVMLHFHVRHLLVLEDEGEPLGLVSFRDLARQMLEQKEVDAAELEEFIVDIYPRPPT